MNGYERVRRFLNGEPVDHVPFTPTGSSYLMAHAGVSWTDYARSAEVRIKTIVDMVRKFDLDATNIWSDFYEQLDDFGQKTVWKDDAPQTEPMLDTPEDLEKLRIPEIKPGTRQYTRVETIRGVAAELKGERFLFACISGPFTEYCNARNLKRAMKDMRKNPELMLRGMEIFYQNAINYIDAQIDAGAEGIEIDEPNCSLINPKFYEAHILPLHKRMVDHVHAKGGVTTLHICGDTNILIPYSLATGTDILGVDTAVDLEKAAAQLGKGQFLMGNLSTTEDLLYGKPENFPALVRRRVEQTGNRILLSGGCSVPPATSEENIAAFHDATAAMTY